MFDKFSCMPRSSHSTSRLFEKKKSILLILLISLILAGCGKKYERTPSGLEYRFIKRGDGMVAASGSTVKVHYTWHWHDTLVRSTYTTLPHYQALIPGVIFPYDPMEALAQGVHEGDSLEVRLRVDSLIAQGRLNEPPPNTQPGDAWRIGIKVLKVYPFDWSKPGYVDSLITADKKLERDRFDSLQNLRGPERIKAYLSKKGINADWNSYGVAVEWIEKGSGPEADSGKLIKMDYKISTLQGKVFDSNMDTSFHRKSPLEFSALTHYFPEAIDKTIASLPAGSRVCIYIPVMRTRVPGMDGGVSVEDWKMEVKIF